jgi:PAS domain S-box-containing protein
VNRKETRYLSFIPIPALVAIILAFYWIIKPSLFYEPPWLLPITNTVFVTVVFLIVAFIAMRNYEATGRIQILLLGCGVLAFGIGGVIAGFVRSIAGAGANLNVTIYNTGALVGAIFHFAAAFILLAGISPEVGSARKEFWLVFGYVGVTIFMALFAMASLGGMIPPFFIQGVGPTALRQWVLGSADVLFAFSFLIFIGLYLKNREVFLYWYSSALALTSISLTAFFVERAVGSPIGWAGRFSQYLGGIYFLIAVITTLRSAQVRRTSFEDILTASLSPAEEKFRVLAEHSPDMIERFDRDMKHVYVNQAGLRLYGKPAGSVIGKTLEETGLQGPSVSLLKERIQKVFETAQPMEVEHYLSTENGTRYHQSRCVPEFGVDGAVVNVLVVSHDLTERKRAEEALQKNKERFEILSGTASRLLATDEPQKVLDQLCRKVMTFLDCHAFFNYLVDEEKGRLHLNAYAGIPEETAKEIEWLDYGVAVCGCAARDACRMVCENIPETPDPRTELVKSFGMKAYASHPLFSEGRTVGTLSFGTRSRTTFTEEELSLMNTVADRVAIAMEKRRLIEALRKSRDELEMRVQERTEELQAINEQLRVENEERLRVEIELRESEGQLRELSAALLGAQERERKLIAQEIHDSMGSSLSAIKFKVESALNEIRDDNRQTMVALESVIPIIKETIEEARRIQMSLRPSILDDLGILATINWFCRQFESTYSNIRLQREIDIQEDEVPESLKIVIYRVLQEALHNIVKHSKADRVHLLLRKMDGVIDLGVQDNGQGFDPGEAQSRFGTGRGLGLDSMRERAGLSGGSFSIESSNGAGTVIRVTWPSEQRFT